jgi:hypothetical protein
MNIDRDELIAFIVCAKEMLPGEADLDALGEESWEMTGIAQHSGMAYFHFKPQTEK